MKSYREYVNMLENSLPAVLQSAGKIPDELLQPMIYSLMSGGKRLRGVLLLAACDAAGGNIDDAVPFACALEMIHAYSLIHDDLPAIDNDDLRRGKPSCHKAFGEAAAILAGDGLLSTAAQVMAETACTIGNIRGMKAAAVILRRAGAAGMAGGQSVDVSCESRDTDPDIVRYIHAHKTADLLTAPMEAGFILAGAENSLIDAAGEYGKNLGMAFQIVDDILDVTGTVENLGKTVHKDEAESKQTWVAAFGLEKARQDAEEYTNLAVRSCRVFDREGFFVDIARNMLTRVK